VRALAQAMSLAPLSLPSRQRLSIAVASLRRWLMLLLNVWLAAWLFGQAVPAMLAKASNVPARNITMRSSGPRGSVSMFPDMSSARGRLTRR
jgi:hypothetical protein